MITGTEILYLNYSALQIGERLEPFRTTACEVFFLRCVYLLWIGVAPIIKWHRRTLRPKLF